MGLISAAAALLRHWMPRTYVRIENVEQRAWFVCDLPQAAEILFEEANALGQVEEPTWAWRDDILLVGALRITFVRMSPRRFEALPEFAGF